MGGLCVTGRSVGGCMCHREGCRRVYVSQGGLWEGNVSQGGL